MDNAINGAVFTLLVIIGVCVLFPVLTNALVRALWAVRESSTFVWCVFDTYLRQTGHRRGPRLNVTRQARRRIAREMARRAV